MLFVVVLVDSQLSIITIGSDILPLLFSLVFFFLLLDLLVDSPVLLILLLDGRPFPRTISGFFIAGVTFRLLNCTLFTFSISEIKISLKEVYKVKAIVGFCIKNCCIFCNNCV